MNNNGFSNHHHRPEHQHDVIAKLNNPIHEIKSSQLVFHIAPNVIFVLCLIERLNLFLPPNKTITTLKNKLGSILVVVNVEASENNKASLILVFVIIAFPITNSNPTINRPIIM